MGDDLICTPLTCSATSAHSLDVCVNFLNTPFSIKKGTFCENIPVMILLPAFHHVDPVQRVQRSVSNLKDCVVEIL